MAWRCTGKQLGQLRIWNRWLNPNNTDTPTKRYNFLETSNHQKGLQKYLFCFQNHHETPKYLLVRQPWKSDKGTSTLDRLNNLRGCIAGKGKASGIWIYFHSTPQSLLCSRCHAKFCQETAQPSEMPLLSNQCQRTEFKVSQELIIKVPVAL